MHPKRIWVLVAISITWGSSAFAQDRHVLSGDEARSLVLAKPIVVVRESGDRSIRFDFRSNGSVFQNTFRAGAGLVSSSGTWHMNDENGKVCVEFTDATTKGVCFGIYQQGEKTYLFTGKRSEPVVWATLN
jgi:hypothetical protein